MKPTDEDLRVGNEIALKYIGRNPNCSTRRELCAQAIASAIATEREKAAKIAETEYADAGYHDFYKQAGSVIAAAIRGQEDAT